LNQKEAASEKGIPEKKEQHIIISQLNLLYLYCVCCVLGASLLAVAFAITHKAFKGISCE
jgi:hypothetical protein